MDGFAADDGHNALLPEYAFPSFPFWEIDFDKFTVWAFPPEDTIGAVLKFLQLRRRQKLISRVVLCVPERRTAPWFWQLQHLFRIARFVSQSDVFRERSPYGVWRRAPRTREPWLILSTFKV